MGSETLNTLRELHKKLPKQLGMTGHTSDFHSVILSGEVDEKIMPVLTASVGRWTSAATPAGRAMAAISNQLAHDDLFNLVTFLIEVANNWPSIEREIHQQGWQEGYDSRVDEE